MRNYRKRVTNPLASFILLLLPAVSAYATAIPRLRLQQLVTASDVITVCNVDSPQFSHMSTTHLAGEIVQTRVFTANVTVLRLLKGGDAGVTVVIYALPAYDTLGYRSVGNGTRLLFLRHSDEGLMPTDPYYPSLPASAAELGSLGSDPLEAVIGVLSAVLASDAESSFEKAQILDVAYAISPDAGFTQSLRRALDTPDPDLKYRVMGNLIRRHDAEALPAAVEALLKPDFPERYRSMVEYAIRTSVDEPSVVPLLTPLARSAHASTRRALLAAFWHIGTWSVVPSATAALADPDREMRYYAVRALAAATGETAWGPSIPEFNDHESKYVQHWKDWAKAHPEIN